MLWLLILSVSILASLPSLAYDCPSEYNRVPNSSDLKVACGSDVINLEVNLCTALWANHNRSNLALNGQHNNSLCNGTIDSSVNPPVIRFQLAVNDSQGNPCRQSLQIISETPSSTGPFSQLSSVQAVIVTGYIDTPSSSAGIISYATDLYYQFTCRYPLEYFINNTKIVASSVSLATNSKNGSFIDNLSLSVYADSAFASPLVVPSTGLQLRTTVYAEVKAPSLTGNFHLLLDHCFATPSEYQNSSNSEKQDFFTMCSVEPRVTVLSNGLANNARFSFEAFRFVAHRSQEKSSIYLHCLLRLCEPTKCESIKHSCPTRRKRSSGTDSGESTTATVSMGPLYTAAMTSDPTAQALVGQTKDIKKENTSGVVVGAIFATAGAMLLVVAGWFVFKKAC